MDATSRPHRATGPATWVGVAVMASAAIAVGAAVASAPMVTALVGLGAIGATALTRRPLVATGLLVASFFFDELLSNGGLVTPGKLIGVMAAAAWLIDTIRNGRPIVTVPQLLPLGLLCVWLVPSLTVVEDSAVGMVVVTRYLMFAALFFLVVQAIDGRYERARALGDVTVLAAAVAAAIGLIGFMWGSEFRASGPLGDANDFGFLMASVLPLAVWGRSQWRGAQRWNPYTIAATLIAGATLATFSRGAIVALAVTGAWSVATGRVPLRKGVAAVLVLISIAGVGYLTQGDLIDESVRQKSYVAQQNVDSRVQAWEVALDQFATSPITGVGPGQYVVRYTDFARPPAGHDEAITTHNAYLNILAELGIPGLLSFLGYLGLSWRSLRRRTTDIEADGFRSAVAGCFLVALVGALFLTEQFYAPLWVFGALGAGELTRDRAGEAGRGRQDRVAATSSISRS